MITEKISRPTLLLDKEKCLRNIERMVEKTNRNELALRPHFKTHQSHEVGRWFRNYGVQAITVSSVRMAAYFAADGWEDITIAFPHNVHESEKVAELAEKIQLQIVVENTASLTYLSEYLKHDLSVFIKADLGYHRTGLEIEQKDQIDAILELIEEHDYFQFKGFLAHAGDSYDARSTTGIMEIHERSLAKAKAFRKAYQADYPEMIISYGDTPCCSAAEHFEGIDELRPGNFVFYDLSQWHIGSCSLDQIAVAMACPVVAKHPERGEAVVYGGGVHFSKDRATNEQEETYYGLLVEPLEEGWNIMESAPIMKSLSQEHGIIKAETEWVEQLEIGQIVFVLPVHSCMTADIMKEYLCLDGSWIRDVMHLH
ncbi:MAG: alanine racemase [Saprospiraceae bacterium]|nr:alanine racemase [Saprospiraceae bacterium]